MFDNITNLIKQKSVLSSKINKKDKKNTGENSSSSSTCTGKENESQCLGSKIASGLYSYVSLDKVSNLGIDEIVNLFTQGNLTKVDMDKWIEGHKKQISEYSFVEKDDIITYKLTYNNQEYTIACTTKASESSTDDNVLTSFYSYDVLSKTHNFTDKQINRYFALSYSNGNTANYILKPNDNYKTIDELKAYIKDLEQEQQPAISQVKKVSKPVTNIVETIKNILLDIKNNKISLNDGVTKLQALGLEPNIIQSGINTMVIVEYNGEKYSTTITDIGALQYQNKGFETELNSATLGKLSDDNGIKQLDNIAEFNKATSLAKTDLKVKADNISAPEKSEAKNIPTSKTEETADTVETVETEETKETKETKGASIKEVYEEIFNNVEIDDFVKLLNEHLPNVTSKDVVVLMDELFNIAQTKGVDPAKYISDRLVEFLDMRAENPEISVEEMKQEWGIAHCDADSDGVKSYLEQKYPSLFESGVLNEEVCSKIAQRSMNILVLNRNKIDIDETAFLKICIEAQAVLTDSAQFLGFNTDSYLETFLPDYLEMACDNYAKNENIESADSVLNARKASTSDNIPPAVKQQFYNEYGKDIKFVMEGDNIIHVYQGENGIGTIDVLGRMGTIKASTYKSISFYYDSQGMINRGPVPSLEPIAFCDYVQNNSKDIQWVLNELLIDTESSRNCSEVLYKLFDSSRDISNLMNSFDMETCMKLIADLNAKFVNVDSLPLELLVDNIAILSDADILKFECHRLFYNIRNSWPSGEQYIWNRILFDSQTEQGRTGDCWFIAGLLSGAQNQNFLNYMQSLFEISNDEISVKIQGHTYSFRTSDIYNQNALATGDLDIRVMEMVARKYFNNTNSKSQNPIIGGGNLKYMVDFLCGDSSIVIEEKSYTTQYIKPKTFWEQLKYQVNKLFGGNDNLFIQHIKSGEYMSNIGSNQEGLKLIDPETGEEVDFVTHHAYAVVGASDDYIYLQNPYDSSKTLKLSIDSFENNEFDYEEVEISTLLEKMKEANENPKDTKKQDNQSTNQKNNQITQSNKPQTEPQLSDSGMLNPLKDFKPKQTSLSDNQNPVKPAQTQDSKPTDYTIPTIKGTAPKSGSSSSSQPANNPRITPNAGKQTDDNQIKGLPHDLIRKEEGKGFKQETNLTQGTITGERDLSHLFNQGELKDKGKNGGQNQAFDDNLRKSIINDAINYFKSKYPGSKVDVWFDKDNVLHWQVEGIPEATLADAYFGDITDDSLYTASLDGAGSINTSTVEHRLENGTYVRPDGSFDTDAYGKDWESANGHNVSVSAESSQNADGSITTKIYIDNHDGTVSEYITTTNPVGDSTTKFCTGSAEVFSTDSSTFMGIPVDDNKGNYLRAMARELVEQGVYSDFAEASVALKDLLLAESKDGTISADAIEKVMAEIFATSFSAQLFNQENEEKLNVNIPDEINLNPSADDLFNGDYEDGVYWTNNGELCGIYNGEIIFRFKPGDETIEFNPYAFIDPVTGLVDTNAMIGFWLAAGGEVLTYYSNEEYQKGTDAINDLTNWVDNTSGGFVESIYNNSCNWIFSTLMNANSSTADILNASAALAQLERACKELGITVYQLENYYGGNLEIARDTIKEHDRAKTSYAERPDWAYEKISDKEENKKSGPTAVTDDPLWNSNFGNTPKSFIR